ncbi:replication protein A 70 kDa DNA-binding subunit [Trifolium repens]|nr:replication protein A 70 kDa DNA-binding subunit [Trifolium repens]
MTGISAEREYVRDGKITKMVIVELTKNSVNVLCLVITLTIRTRKLGKSANGLPIVVVQFAKVKSFRDKASIQNVINTTRLLINPYIPEVEAFMNNDKMVHNEKGKVDIKFDDVADILPGKENICINVRVLRLWMVPAFLNPCESSFLDMILIDKKGGKINATIRKQLIYMLESKLEEGEIYEMLYFTESSDISHLGLSFTNLTKICAYTHDYEFLTIEAGNRVCMDPIIVEGFCSQGPFFTPSMTMSDAIDLDSNGSSDDNGVGDASQLIEFVKDLIVTPPTACEKTILERNVPPTAKGKTNIPLKKVMIEKE